MKINTDELLTDKVYILKYINRRKQNTKRNNKIKKSTGNQPLLQIDSLIFIIKFDIKAAFNKKLFLYYIRTGVFRGAFRILSNILDGVFCKNS